MAYIDSTSFGSITINSKLYGNDIKVLASGKILNRLGPKGSHRICIEEFNEILGETKRPKTIIIGTGQGGVAKLESGVKAELEKQNIKVIEAPTQEAIKIFNKTKEPRASLFHLTC